MSGRNDYSAGWYAGYNSLENAAYNSRYRAGYDAGIYDAGQWHEGYNDFLNGNAKKSPACKYYYWGYNSAESEFNQGYNDARGCGSYAIDSAAYLTGWNRGCDQNYNDGYNDIYFQSLPRQRSDSERYEEGYVQGYNDAWYRGFAHGLAGFAKECENMAYVADYDLGSQQRLPQITLQPFFV